VATVTLKEPIVIIRIIIIIIIIITGIGRGPWVRGVWR